MTRRGYLMPRLIDLREYESVIVDDLSVEQIRLLRAALPSLKADYAGADRWTLKAGHHVGYVRVDDLQVHVEPKINIWNLLYLLLDGVGLPWRADMVETATQPRLVDAFAQLFARAVRQATRSGVLQGYLRREASLRVVRGQWLVNQQLRRQFHQLVPVEVAYNEYTENIPENQLIVTAGEVLRRTTNALPSRHVVQQVLAPFAEQIEPLPRWQWSNQPAINWTPLNSHYRMAAELARIVLTHAATSHQAGSVGTSGLVININHAFERFVRHSLRRALAGPGHEITKCSPRDGLRFDAAGQVVMEPDILWHRHGTLRLVADAKYKRLAPARYRHADLYQMHAYCTASKMRVGLLIYGEGEISPRRHQIRGDDTTISVIAVDLGGGPDDIQASIAAVAAEARYLADAGDQRDGSMRLAKPEH
jgi:5-methylcytosine-specific restriction enzyme subunit McrC